LGFESLPERRAALFGPELPDLKSPPERLGLDASSLRFSPLFPKSPLGAERLSRPRASRLPPRLLSSRLPPPPPRFSDTSTFTYLSLCLKSVKKANTFSCNSFSVLKNEKLSLTSTLKTSSLPTSKTSFKKSFKLIQS